jgi:hypothetical protein
MKIAREGKFMKGGERILWMVVRGMFEEGGEPVKGGE